MRVVVAGIRFDNVTMEETVEWILRRVRDRGTADCICTGNLDHLVMLQYDVEFREIYERSGLVLPDGTPVVWLSRLCAGGPLRERVAGSDLFWELTRASAEHGLRLYFLGGAPGSADRAAEAVAKKYPQAQICGTYCPPFKTFATEEEQERIREKIRAAQPDVLLVGLGAPKQEKWIAANKDLLQVPVSVGVGGSFEMAAGLLRRAPKWMHSLGMEWCYRLMQEPRRLAKRYLLCDLPFLVGMALCTLAGRARRSG